MTTTESTPAPETEAQNSGEATPLFNEETVNTLKKLMGPRFATLKQTFINNAGQKLAALNRALASSDIETIKLLVHSLKGSCGTIGASGMAAMAKNIEDAIEASDHELIKTLIQALEALFKTTAAKLQEMPIPE
jgi:HPt (histidine-containing phosphotransfer) domain-containing protein